MANSNDLKVLVAEANALNQPESAKERVLAGFVEKAVKEHYRDQAKQASIVDYLEMRNVIYTGKSFHSFGEIVKKETDEALQALLSGRDDFSLIGSHDVQKIFNYYLTRHGDPYLVDINDGRKSPKRPQLLSEPDEIRAKDRKSVMNAMPIRLCRALAPRSWKFVLTNKG